MKFEMKVEVDVGELEYVIAQIELGNTNEALDVLYKIVKRAKNSDPKKWEVESVEHNAK